MIYQNITFEEFGWRNWVDECNYKESKIHLTTDNGRSTLCGIVTKPENGSLEFSGDYGHGDCLRCSNKADKLNKGE
tara:strand:- start:881 stop:1108 length:228 start_codon:yes stop_codon:yes gene_type:complete